jgi:hypothetical protein
MFCKLGRSEFNPSRSPAARSFSGEDMKQCEWEDDDDCWATSCGQLFVINDGTPSQNGMKYCCYCGGELVEKPPAERDDAA